MEFEDPNTEVQLQLMKDNFIEFVRKHQTIVSEEFEKYKEMTVKEFIMEMSDKIAHYQMFKEQYIDGINSALGLGADENPEIRKTLEAFVDFFSDIIDIIYST